LDRQRAAVMEETIEDRRGERVVAEGGAPLGDELGSW
jgi:hypothetical protein